MKRKAKTLADLVDGRGLHSVDPGENLRTACIKMTSHNIGALAVVQRGGKLVGILSERDIIKRSVIVYRPSESTTVREVMTSDPAWLPADAAPQEAYALMTAKGFRHVPVCRNGIAVGMVSIRDFQPARSSQLSKLRGGEPQVVAITI
ncbi:MAG: CBS domain-containing protein [Pseudomonadota bacterium]